MLEYVLENELADVASDEAAVSALGWVPMSAGRRGLLAAAYVRPN